MEGIRVAAKRKTVAQSGLWLIDFSASAQCQSRSDENIFIILTNSSDEIDKLSEKWSR